MNLTTKGRYAVMAMADLAMRSKSEPVSLVTIAMRQEIALSYLEQIFMKLRRFGLVKSVRGPGGGYILSREAADINIAQIILAVNEPMKMTRCDKNGGCMKDKATCVTHKLWEGLGIHIEEYLRSISLDSICEEQVLIV